jgi:hypothetical protein
MKSSEPKFTVGVEEEYLLVDQESRALVIDPPEDLMHECEKRLGEQVTAEGMIWCGCAVASRRLRTAMDWRLSQPRHIHSAPGMTKSTHAKNVTIG